MPKPDNIVLRNLTGGPTLGPPVKGATSPLISTVLVQRDGTRGGTEQPGDPPPVGEQGTPITDGLSYVDPRFSGATYPPLTPGRTVPGATADPSFTMSKIEYLGAFFVGGRDSWTLTRLCHGFCHNPPNGNNGPLGSIFVSYVNGPNFPTEPIKEFQIPETLGTDFNTLPEATEINGPVELMEGTKTLTAPNPGGHNSHGFMRVIDGKLFVYTIKGYSNDLNTTGLVVADDATDLQNSTLHGRFNFNTGFTGDMFCTYLFEIPPSKRSIFNNHSHISGNHIRWAINGRFSKGPSFYGWNPENINLTSPDTTAGTIYTYYPLNDDFVRYSSENYPVKDHFDALTGLDYHAWVMVPKGGTEAQNTYDRLVGDLAVPMLGRNGTEGDSAALPEYGIYTSTIVVKNSGGTVTYTEGVDYTVSIWKSEYEGYGYGQKILYGKHIITRVSSGAIALNETLSVSYTYLSKRYDDFTYYPYPDKSVPFDVGNESSAAMGGFFVPNTNTIMIIGDSRGARYGSEYKAYDVTRQQWEGGPIVRDERDWDDQYFLYNVNDITSGNAYNDIKPYQYGIFDENRWSDYKGSGFTKINHLGAFYDPATKRLYVLHYRVKAPWDGQDDRSALCSVYYVNY